MYNIQPSEGSLKALHNKILEFLSARSISNARLKLEAKRVLQPMNANGSPLVFDLVSGQTSQDSKSPDRKVLANEAFFAFGVDARLRRVTVVGGKPQFGNSVFRHYPDPEIHDAATEVESLNAIYMGTGEIKVGDVSVIRFLMEEFYYPNNNGSSKDPSPTERADGGNVHLTSQYLPCFTGNVVGEFVINLPSPTITTYTPEGATPGDLANYVEFYALGYTLDTTQEGINQATIDGIVTAWNTERKFSKC